MDDFIFEVKNLQVNEGSVPILNIPDLRIKKEEILAIIGPNGSGKTTLLQILSLLRRPSHGEIIFDSHLVKKNDNLLPLRRRMAMVFQEPLLFHMSVFKNIASGLKFRNMKSAHINEKVFTWMERLNIIHLKNRFAGTLSVGESQRVSLARALVLEPEFLLMDEPFASLDVPTKENLINDLDLILHKNKVTTIFSTHDRSEALHLGDKIGVLIDGSIMQVDLPQIVFTFPINEPIAKFVGTENILPGRIISVEQGLAAINVNGKTIYAVCNGALHTKEVFVCLRPENIIVFPQKPGVKQSSSRNNLIGLIKQINPFGSQYKLTVDCGFPLIVLITAQSISDLNLSIDSTIYVSFKANSIHIIPRAE